MVRYVETALDIIPHEDQYMQAQASSILSTTDWASGELDKSFELMSNWVNAAQQAGNIVFAVAASFGKADILITQGRLHDAMQGYQTALSLATEHGAEQHTAHHHLGLGLLHHEMGEDERAAYHLQKAFELGRQTTIVEWMYRKSLAQAYLKESEGDLRSALRLAGDVVDASSHLQYRLASLADLAQLFDRSGQQFGRGLLDLGRRRPSAPPGALVTSCPTSGPCSTGCSGSPPTWPPATATVRSRRRCSSRRRSSSAASARSPMSSRRSCSGWPRARRSRRPGPCGRSPRRASSGRTSSTGCRPGPSP